MTEEKNPYRKDGKSDEGLSWRQLMWKNFYIQLFIIALAALVGEFYLIDSFYSFGGFILGISIPIGVMILIAYKGFYQFWRQYSKGK